MMTADNDELRDNLSLVEDLLLECLHVMNTSKLRHARESRSYVMAWKNGNEYFRLRSKSKPGSTDRV